MTERVSELERQLAPQTVQDALAQLNSVMNGAPGIFGIAGNRLKTALQQTSNSAERLADEVVDLETHIRNQRLLGRWTGTLSRGGLGGTIELYFQKGSAHGDKISGVIGHTFHGDGNRTTGKFTGKLGPDNKFRGRATVRNSSGSGSFAIVWDLDGNRLHGRLYQGEGIHFDVHKQ